MDGWLFWIYLKIGLSILTLVICFISAVVIWRVRGIWQWQHSLNTEIRMLEQKADRSSDVKRSAIHQVLRHCKNLQQSHSPNPDMILHLNDYLRCIAACYYPDSDRPELCLTLGQTLTAAQEMIERLDEIIKRKGLRRFAWIRIKHIRKALSWYTQISQYRVLGWMLRHQSVLARVMHIRRIILPDPFSWMAYFSNRLTILMLTRTLLLDIYLFIGQLAVDAYDAQTVKEDVDRDDNLAETLANLYDSEQLNGWQNYPKIAEIRDRLVGAPKRIILPPTLQEWRRSIAQAAQIIAARHFNHSKAPLDEAALGPMIVQLQSLLRSISDVSRYSGVKQLFGIRLASIQSAHAFANNVSGWRMTGLAQKAWGGYRTLRWPVKIFRWAKRSSPTGIAMDLGLEAFRKALINYLARLTFDRTCREIDGLYRKSRRETQPKENDADSEMLSIYKV